MSQFEKGNKSGFDRRTVTMIALSTLKKILERNEERLPLLTLDDFFNGNTAEDSIAPNQWGFGRPTLSEIWNMLQKIELLPKWLCSDGVIKTKLNAYSCVPAIPENFDCLEIVWD